MNEHILVKTLDYYDRPLLILTRDNENNYYLGLYLFNDKYLGAYLNKQRLDLLIDKGLEIREPFLNTERPLLYLSESLEVMGGIPTLDIEDLAPEGNYISPIGKVIDQSLFNTPLLQSEVRCSICRHSECLYRVRPRTHLCNQRTNDTFPLGYDLLFCAVCQRYRERPV